MGEIVKLPFKEQPPRGPTLIGDAFCGACGHEWPVQAPVSTTHFKCPSCNRLWGALKHSCEPETSWRCDCGEMLFWLTPKGALCRRCGVIVTEWAE